MKPTLRIERLTLVLRVEDLQWTRQTTVFASAECGYVRVFDTRAPKKAMLSHKIHASSADVNVLSWNKLRTYWQGGTMVFYAWDLRHFSGE
jgi:hypothetical protein